MALFDLQMFAADGHLWFDTKIDTKGFESGIGKIGSIAKTGLMAIGGISAGLMTAGAVSVKVGQEFETSLAKASTLFGDVNVDTDHLKSNLLAVSDATGIAASELNESLYSALSAGIPATENMAEATAFLESSARLAKAGFTDMDTALSATAKTLNAYGLDVSEADRINKILIQTQNKGITTVGELGASLAQVTPTAAAFGVSFENVGAALSNMTAAGTPTAQATTQLNALIAELGKSGTTGAKSLEAAAKGTKLAGMNFKEMMDSGIPLNEVLDLIQKSADKTGLSMVDMFSSIEAGKAAMALSGSNSKKFASNLEAMGTSADVVAAAYEKVSDTLENKIEKIYNSAKNLGIQVYNGIQDPLKGIADMALVYLDELASAFKEDGIEGLVNAGSDIVANVVTGIVEQLPSVIDMAVGFLTTFVNSLNKNMPQMVEAGGRLITALADGCIRLLPSLLSLGISLLDSIIQGILSNLGKASEVGNSILDELLEILSDGLPEMFSRGTELIGKMSEGLLGNLPQIIQSAGQILQKLLDAILSGLPKMIQSGLELMAKLAEGIWNNFPAIVSAIGQVLGQLLATIVFHLPDILNKGIEIIGQLAAGIVRAIPSVVSVIPKVISGIVKGFTSYDWGEIGKNIISGVAEGIAKAAGKIAKAAKDAAKQAFESAKDFLGIHSPSTLFRDQIGRNMALGMAEGFDKNIPEYDFDRIAGNAVSAMQESVGIVQGMPLQTISKNDQVDLIDYDKMGEKMAEAMEGMRVDMDGKPVGRLTAPEVNRSMSTQEELERRGAE